MILSGALPAAALALVVDGVLALVERAVELGFCREQVVVIDEDLGISGSGLSDRSGFARGCQFFRVS